MAGEWHGKWALVTGASAGIGQALAEELAAGGANLVLTARRKERLEELAQRLAEKHKIQTQVFAADLAETTAPQKIFGIYESEGNGSRAADQQRGIRAIRRVPYSRDSAAAGDGAGELQRGGASDPAVSAGNGGEATG
jgi:NAD(P)-dependent dehydrogenase (short-subunit alcohol dehydrogenase family)